MARSCGKYEKTQPGFQWRYSYLWVPAAFFLVEAFAFIWLQPEEMWPLLFGGLWAVILGGILWLLPGKGSRTVFAVLYGFFAIYTVVQTGYYQLFSEMMWLSEFRYASEGSDYFSILLHYPVLWFLGILGLLILGGFLVWK